ncbi:MAG: hypothetical protein ACOC04_06215 [Halothece sp.]
MSNQSYSISSSETMRNSLFDTTFDKFFRDKNGNIVLAQKPNLPILVALTATLFKLLFPTSGNLSVGLEAVTFGSLFTWAWMELFQGINYFRRTLGFIALLGIIALQLQWG